MSRDAVQRCSTAALMVCAMLSLSSCATHQLWQWAHTDEPVNALRALGYREFDSGGAELVFAPRDPTNDPLRSVTIPARWSARPIVSAGAAWRLAEPIALQLAAMREDARATVTLADFAVELFDDVPRFEIGPPTIPAEARYAIGWMPIESGTRFAVFGRTERSPEWVYLGRLDVIEHPLHPLRTALAVVATPVTVAWDLVTTPILWLMFEIGLAEM